MSLVSCRACGSALTTATAACPTCGLALAPSAGVNAILVLTLAGLGVSLSGILIPLLL